MASVAFRNVSVLISMAVSAGHIRRMLARILLELIAHLAVAKGAGCRDLTHRDHERRVWIGMTVQARGQVLVFSVKVPPSRTYMTPRAIGHNLIVILLSGVIDMVFSMATHTVDLMSAARLFDGLKNRVMTLATLYRCQRFNVHLIGGLGRRFLFLGFC
jgi:hypothetical protein